jgi:hypothetical protein
MTRAVPSLRKRESKIFGGRLMTSQFVPKISDFASTTENGSIYRSSYVVFSQARLLYPEFFAFAFAFELGIEPTRIDFASVERECSLSRSLWCQASQVVSLYFI